MTNGNGRDFSKWLSRTMELRGVSGRQIARALGKDDGTVSKWKTGQAVPTNANEVLKLGTMLEAESPLRLLVNAGIIDPDQAAEMNLEPLPIPEYDPARERKLKKIKATGAPREAWDDILRAWEEKERKR